MTQQYPRATEQERASCVVEVASVPPINLASGIETNIVCGKDLTLSFPTIVPNCVGKMHSHPHEQMIIVLEGSVDLIMSGKAYALKSGDVASVPSNVEHMGITHDTKAKLIEVFVPARKDLEEKLAQAKAAQKQK